MNCPHCNADITNSLDQFGEPGREICRACWLGDFGGDPTPEQVDEITAALARDLKLFMNDPKGWAA